MQPLVEPVRDHLTDEQVVALLQDAPAIALRAGMELVDLDLTVLDDLSDDLAGGQIRRDSYAVLHATATFSISRELDWGSALVRPYLIVSDGSIEARFNLGVYHPNRPQSGTSPAASVEGYDILYRLSQPVGEAYAVAAGVSYLTELAEILASLGYTQVIIDQTAADKVLPTSRVWAFADATTWLMIVNDMLASIGYAGIWSDWDGRLRLHPYVLPQDRRVEWTYSDDPATSMLGEDRTVSTDYWDAPNRWVVYQSNGVDGPAPVEGAGIYTYVNQSVGPTSVDARGGLVITRVEGVDAADQAALVAQAQAMIQADMDIPTVISVPTSPNPLHWHFDRVSIRDSGTLPWGEAQCTEWTLSLPPETSDMQQTWRLISQ